jgi:putative ABC transport system substrate-binding protein
VITTLADRYKLPAVYPFRYFVGVGGLMSYGPDLVSQFRPAAGYVDRILKGDRRPCFPTPDGGFSSISEVDLNRNGP